MAASSSRSGNVRRRNGGADRSDTLFRRWRYDRDAHARSELFERWAPLARRLAKRYRRSTEPFEDLHQVACMGLLLAIDRYDPDRGTHFPAFAVPTVLGELKRYFRSTAWSAHVPRGMQELTLRVRECSDALYARSGHLPSVNELAQYLELSTEEVLLGLQAGRAQYGLSLGTPLPTEDGEFAALSETLGTVDAGYAAVESRLMLRAASGHLTVDERRALRLRLDRGLTQTQIGAELGCSQMQVSRLLRQAGTKLSQQLSG